MKAAVYKGNQTLVIEDIPVADLKHDEILVKIKYSAICGSDVHAFLYDLIDVGHVPGHEYSGVVELVGSSIKRFKKGDRVAGGGGTPPPGYENPMRIRDQFNFIHDGIYRDVTRTRGFAEYSILKEWEPIKLTDQISDLQGALIEPCAVAVRAVRVSNQKLGDNVLVLGAGPIGLLCLQVAKAAGASKVVVSEPSSVRREAALSLGADVVIDSSDPDISQTIISATDNAGPDVVFECAAAPSTLDLALDVVRRDGNVTLVALAWRDVPIVPVKWAAKEISMLTTFGTEAKDWKIASELISKGDINLDPMLSKTDLINLDDIQEAFESLIKPNELNTIIKIY